MDAGADAASGLTVLQVVAGFVAVAIVLVGAAWFWARWQAHDEQGRPRPPDAEP